MSSLAERGTARGQKKMEGVNMPASLKFAWRWIVGATAAAIIGLVALPGVGQAQTLSICINNGNGRVRGINVPCLATQTQLSWQITGPTGAAGPQGPQGLAGLTGPTGPSGIQGNPGIRGLVGLGGATGVGGTNGTSETGKTFLTGGSLGTFGYDEDIALSGLNFLTILGPGNGSEQYQNVALNTAVPMNDAGEAYNFFVRLDHNPGTDPATGVPMSYTFYLCNFYPSADTCAFGDFLPGVTCTITDPDTTCNNLIPAGGGFNPFAPGDLLAVWVFNSDVLANPADVTWSVTYDKSSPF